jgi:hypothetical protein
MADYAKPLVTDNGFGSRDLPMSTECGGMVISTDAADQTDGAGFAGGSVSDRIELPG